MHEVIEQLVREFQDKQNLAHLRMDEAFETFAAHCVLHQFHEENFNPDVHRVGGGNDLGVDAYGIVINGDLYHDLEDVRAAVDNASEINVAVIVIQAKTSSGFEGKTVSDLADNLEKICSLKDIPYDASAEIQDFQECLRAIFKNLGKLPEGSPRLHVRYVTTGGEVATHIERKCRSAEQQLHKLERFTEITVDCVTRTDLRKLYIRAENAVTVDLVIPTKTDFPPMPDVKQGWLGLLPAKHFIDAVLTDDGGSIRKSLFHDNVRDFAGYGNKVNASIRETLRDEVDQRRFAVLNNGITIVARRMTTNGQEVQLHDFQIVNGGQTCHVLFENRNALSDSVFVKLTVVCTSSEAVARGVIVATNQQTAITAENISSQEDFHGYLETFFLGQAKPRDLYYERRANQYQTRADIEKTRVISQRRLGQAYATVFLGEAASATRYAELQRRLGDRLFRRDDNQVAYYTAASVWYRVEWLLRNQRIAKEFAPAKFLLMAGFRHRLVGDRRLPKRSTEVGKLCEPILAAVWNPAESERLIADLLPTLDALLVKEQGDKARRRELFRNRGFVSRFLAEINGG